MQLRSSSDPAENDDTPVPVQKALAAMTAFSSRYVKVSGTKYCSEPSSPRSSIRGSRRTQGSLGRAALPCRNYVDKEAEAKSGYWNCPCVPMRAPAWKSNGVGRPKFDFHNTGATAWKLHAIGQMLPARGARLAGDSDEIWGTGASATSVEAPLPARGAVRLRGILAASRDEILAKMIETTPRRWRTGISPSPRIHGWVALAMNSSGQVPPRQVLGPLHVGKPARPAWGDAAVAAAAVTPARRSMIESCSWSMTVSSCFMDRFDVGHA